MFEKKVIDLNGIADRAEKCIDWNNTIVVSNIFI